MVFLEDNRYNGIVQDVYKIAVMLLEHGADPDVKYANKTTREWVKSSADPRIRSLF